MIKLAPSILAADLLRLGEDVGDALAHGVEWLHFDVMDAHFVPNLSFGPALCAALHRRFPSCRLDVHLMMENPEGYIETFARAGAYAITVHQEVFEDAEPALRKIRACGARCGLSVKPGTGAETLLPYLDQLDQILIMTVEPGFGGQELMLEQLDKIRFLRKRGFAGDIAVDGGVNLDNMRSVAEAGASLLVLGTAFFHAPDRLAVIRAAEEFP